MKKSSGIAVAAVALGRGTGAMASEPHIEFPTEPRARLSVASYPFRDFISSPHWKGDGKTKPIMDIKGFGAMVVEKFNVKNIEPWSPHFPFTDASYVAELRAAFDKAGSHVINIPDQRGSALPMLFSRLPATFRRMPLPRRSLVFSPRAKRLRNSPKRV